MQTRRRPLVALVVAPLLAAVTLGGCVPAPALTVTTVLSGLHRPWDLAFTPGGAMVFTEKAGAIRVRMPGSARLKPVRQGDVLAHAVAAVRCCDGCLRAMNAAI